MLIIVEGPDGAGKSTLVDRLDRALWEAGRGCVLVNHKAAPRRHQLEEYARDLCFYRPGGEVDLILDRCWRSDLVYGPRWRGHHQGEDVSRYLDLWAVARGAVYVQLDAPDDVLAERVLRRGDDKVDPAEVAELAADYRALPHWPGLRIRLDQEMTGYPMIIDSGRERALAVQDIVENAPSYVGPAVPTCLLLEARSESVARAGYVSAFPPLPGSAAAQVLWPALRDPAFEWAGVVNARETADLGQLVRDLGSPDVVALGSEAREAARRQGVAIVGAAPHPQFVKRFFYGRRGEYAEVLAAAAAGSDQTAWFGPTDPAHPDYQTPEETPVA